MELFIIIIIFFIIIIFNIIIIFIIIIFIILIFSDFGSSNNRDLRRGGRSQHSRNSTF